MLCESLDLLFKLYFSNIYIYAVVIFTLSCLSCCQENKLFLFLLAQFLFLLVLKEDFKSLLSRLLMWFISNSTIYLSTGLVCKAKLFAVISTDDVRPFISLCVWHLGHRPSMLLVHILVLFFFWFCYFICSQSRDSELAERGRCGMQQMPPSVELNSYS